MPTSIEELTPKLNIIIQNTRLSSKSNLEVISATVSEDLDAPSMLALKLSNWDLIKSEVTASNEKDLFNSGSAIKIQMGYPNQLETVFLGEITGLEVDFAADAEPTLLVTGHDFRHRLIRGHKTRSWKEIKDSDIVSQIAREQKLLTKITDTKVIIDYVCQSNQTDMEFLQKRAKRLGYELAMEGQTLCFRPPQNIQGKALTLKKKDLVEFYSRSSTMQQVAIVEVRNWDIKQKKVVISRSGVGDENCKMNGKTSGPSAAKTAFGNATHVVFTESLSNSTEADEIAKGLFNEMALAYVGGEGTCQGNPNIRAGKVIEINDVGNKFSGLYYVISVKHDYSKKQGYKTKFTVRRNAI
jgi:uncharacterized protein